MDGCLEEIDDGKHMDSDTNFRNAGGASFDWESTALEANVAG
jgi:hypothetical protein